MPSGLARRGSKKMPWKKAWRRADCSRSVWPVSSSDAQPPQWRAALCEVAGSSPQPRPGMLPLLRSIGERHFMHTPALGCMCRQRQRGHSQSSFEAAPMTHRSSRTSQRRASCPLCGSSSARPFQERAVDRGCAAPRPLAATAAAPPAGLRPRPGRRADPRRTGSGRGCGDSSRPPRAQHPHSTPPAVGPSRRRARRFRSRATRCRARRRRRRRRRTGSTV